MNVRIRYSLMVLVLSLCVGAGLVAATHADAPPTTAAQAQGEAFRANMETAEQELAEALEKSFATLEQSLREVTSKAQSVQSEAIALNALRSLVKELRAQGQAVLESQRRFVTSAGDFAERLGEGPACFRAMATEFRGFAVAETHKELTDDYLATAATFEALAQRCEVQLQRLKPSIDEYRDNLSYIERSLLFLTRLDKALAMVPDLTEFDRLDDSLTQLSRYVNGFHRLRGSLHEFDKRLHAPVQTSNPTAPPAKRALQTAARRRS